MGWLSKLISQKEKERLRAILRAELQAELEKKLDEKLGLAISQHTVSTNTEVEEDVRIPK